MKIRSAFQKVPGYLEDRQGQWGLADLVGPLPPEGLLL